MKVYDLTPEEIELLEAFEKGELKSLGEDLSVYKKAAQAQIQKTKNINIRLTERDVLGMKAKAMEEGIPYQTLAASILHKYVTGKLKSV